MFIHWCTCIYHSNFRKWSVWIVKVTLWYGSPHIFFLHPWYFKKHFFYEVWATEADFQVLLIQVIFSINASFQHNTVLLKQFSIFKKIFTSQQVNRIAMVRGFKNSMLVYNEITNLFWGREMKYIQATSCDFKRGLHFSHRSSMEPAQTIQPTMRPL